MSYADRLALVHASEQDTLGDEAGALESARDCVNPDCPRARGATCLACSLDDDLSFCTFMTRNRDR